MQWCLGGRRVGRKSPVEVQPAQKLTELTGGLWRVAALEMVHSFFQRSRTHGGHFVSEDGDLGSSEDALRRVDDPMPQNLVEDSP
jgi:hypothetical protein